MDLSFIEKIAPTLASALGGPLAGIAVSTLGNALGWNDATKDDVTKMLSTGQLSGDQAAALQKAELELKQHESDNGFKFSELETRDMESARQREIAVKDKMPAVLAVLAISSGIIVTVMVFSGNAPALKDPVLAATAGTIVGYVFGEIKQVYAYYFGSTSSSRTKDATIAAQAAK